MSDLTIIGEHAKNAMDQRPASDDNRLQEIESRVADLEFLREEIGLENRYREELHAYVKDLRDEVSQIRIARYLVGICSLVAAIALFVLPYILTGFAPAWFTQIANYPKAALIIGSFASGVLLLLTITKSVFRSAHERQNDEFIPPQIKMIHELMKSNS